jgi:hypothetical protein
MIPRKSVWAVALVCAIVAGARVQASDAMEAIVRSYLDIQRQLAADKADGVKPAALAIGEQALRMGTAGEGIVTSARAVAAAADIKAVRLAFGDLSDAVIAAGRAEGWKDVPDVKVAYCPMARKFWVQTEPEIRNPYYGKAMLTCGEFKAK